MKVSPDADRILLLLECIRKLPAQHPPVLRGNTEPNCPLPFQMFPSTATKEPFCATRMEVGVHPSPTLSKRLKKKKKER